MQGCTQIWDKERKLQDNFQGLDGGLLNVYDDRVYFLLDRQQKIEYQSVYDRDGNTIDRVVTEEWMKDSAERRNQIYTELYRGFNDYDVELVFRQQAQNSSIAISSDKNTIYISTEFSNKKIAEIVPKNDPNFYKKVYSYHIFKSTDGGTTFEKTPWNISSSVKQILFDKTGVYGYALGEDRTLWRTNDGAKTWKEITIPDEFRLTFTQNTADRPSISYNWDAFYFDQSTKKLYLSCFVHDKQIKGQGKSVLYEVPWNEELTNLNNLKSVASVANHFVTDIKPAGKDKFLLLTETYNFEDYYTMVEHKNSHFVVLEQNKVFLDHDFGKKYFLGALFIGKNNLYYIIGTKERGIASYDDIALISTNGGQDWHEEKESIWLQGNYFDPETNKAWAYKQGTLYSRTIK